MREAVIISTARIPIGIAFKGALNNIKSSSHLGIARALVPKRIQPGFTCRYSL